IPNKFKLLKSWINPFSKDAKMPNIKDIITRSVLISGVKQRIKATKETPFFIGMPVENLNIMDVSKIAQFIKIGYEHAKPIVSRWKSEGSL
ncbi:MAG: hypothetical protein WCK42_09055, partial [Myxococcaceae bacterium]